MTLSTPDIERLKGLLEKATPGPWAADAPFDDGDMMCITLGEGRECGAQFNEEALCLVYGMNRTDEEFTANAALIVAAINALPALPALLADRADLEAENADLTKALTGLTRGGSEYFIRKGDRYVADIPVCVAYVSQFKQDKHEHICREIRTRQAAEAKVADLEGECERLRAALSAEGHAYEASLSREDEWATELDKRGGSLQEEQEARLATEAENARLRARVEALEEGLRLIGATADYRKDAPLNFRLEERLADIATDARALLHEGEK